MIHAGQKALFQEQNQRVLGIRQAEMDYFTNFYTNFATQSALVMASVTGAVTNIVPDHDHPTVINDFFYIAGGLTFAFSMHSLLCSVFTIVFAPNLALHGPLGSMVRAIDGMIAEQDQIFLCFVLSLVFFTINTISWNWILMTDEAAAISSIAIIIASGGWYTYCLRIYNRFKMHTSSKVFEEDIRIRGGDVTVKDQLSRLRESHIVQKHNNDDDISTIRESNVNFRNTFANSIRNTMASLTGGKKSDVNRDTLSPLYEPLNEGDSSGGGYYTTPHSASNPQMSGYMTYMLTNVRKSTLSNNSSKPYRKFFVMDSDIGVLIYYASEREFATVPENPESPRPIRLREYSCEILSSSSIYKLCLTPYGEDRASWEFTLDNSQELHAWSNAFSFFCNRNSTTTERDVVV